MYDNIQKKVPYEQMIFEHQGEIRNGVEESKGWAGATERYYLSDRDGVTELKVAIDLNEEFKGYFSTTFPKALAVVKQMAEQ